MKEKRNTTMLIIIIIAFFLVFVIGATYAFFSYEDVRSAINVGVETTGKMYQFTASSNDSIEMNITDKDMRSLNVSENAIKSNNATINVSLASPNDDTYTKCTYDIVWVWDSENMYTTPDMELPGHKITITEEQYNDINYTCDEGYSKASTQNTKTSSYDYYCQSEKIYNYELSTMVDGANETDLSKLTRDGNKVILYEGASIESMSEIATTKTHDVRVNIYNLPVFQEKLFMKGFKAHVTIDNLNCNMTNDKPLAYHVINTVYNSSENQTNIANKAAGLYFHDSDVASSTHLANGAEDNTYRYAGAGELVNNYVCFEGDDCTKENNLYRIISVDSTTKQTKVIKATKLASKMNWNEKTEYTAQAGDEGLTSGKSYTNIWAYLNEDGTYYTSSLNDYLNGKYLTSLGDKANKIVATTWKIGGYANDQRLTSTPKQIYDIEKADRVTYPAKIGLMYASEYGFAALPEYWNHVIGYNDTNGYNLIQGKDWILTSASFEWTISRRSDYVNRVFAVIARGDVSNDYVYRDYELRPTFVLTSDVKITNAGVEGIGSKANPMIIV